MEAAWSSIAEQVINFVWDQGIKKHGAYIVCYTQNVKELNRSVKDLGHVKERIDHQRDEAEKNLHRIESKVTEWFQEVGEFETKFEKYGNDEGHKKTWLPNCLFPYFRHRLGRRAKKMVEEVKKLIDESPKSDEVAHTENLTSNDASLSNAGYMEFGSRKSTMEDIMTKLEDPTVRMVGLHGPGGVGKSTLIKGIAKNALDKKLFDVVAKVEITANPNLQRIQEEIAYVLRLRLEGEGENVRADCLRRRLKQETENTLIILDDLWDRLDLNKLGIPLDDDDDLTKKTSNDKQDPKGVEKEKSLKEKSLGDYKGCKILLTSRDKNVLSEKMVVKSIFSIKELDDTDALMLLQKVTGIPDEMSHFKEEIVKFCARLPMAIVTVGRALRDKSESEWKATIEKLKKQELVGVQNPMEISIKMSYDHLENEELKSIFLLCAQMGHQPLIMDLVKYCFGLGILEGVYSLGEARDRIYTSIQKLKDSGLDLVLDGSSSIHFNMHDLVRDAALSIAHKEQNVFTLRNGKLEDWPELKRCTSISICNSDIIDELPEVINCPQLKFFQIDSDDPSLEIPDRFFKGMKKLRVLILIGIHLSSLPSSIESLSNLRLLCLERCSLDQKLSIIGKLKKLRILSFSGSRIENLPADLGSLDKLQLLDISNCSIKKMIPPNFISRLTSLEELYIRKSLIKTLVEGDTNQSQISFLSHLHQLKVVDLNIPCTAVFPKNLFFDKLNDYKIVIGDFKMLSVGDFRMPDKYEAVRSLSLELKDSTEIHSQKGIKLLFKRVENLLLGELNGVQNVIDELNLDGFPYLKHLSIANNNDIKYINSMDLSNSRDVFPNLECLSLYELRSIEKICCSPVTIASFAKLKTMKVKGCTDLKNLFSLYKDKFVASLETIDVSECGSLKEIVEIIVNTDKVEFLKLHSLTLQSLSSFTSFYNRVEGSSVSQLTEAHITDRDDKEITIAHDEHSDMAPTLFGELVEIPNLESLNLSSVRIHKIWSDQPQSSFCFQNLVKLVVKDCDNLKYLCSLSVASGLKKLKGLFVSECPLMEKIFETEGNSADKVCVFPKLEEIHLTQMNMLTDIWHAEVSADSFSSLISVHIHGCKKLDKIFPSHMEGWFASLNSLKVSMCESVEVIFEIKDSQQVDASGGIDTNLQLIDVWGLPNLKQVWSRDPGGILNFKKLHSVEVFSCDKLRNVFPASVAKDIQKLEYMSVKYCKQMVEIVACEDGSETNNEQLVFPELTYVELHDLSNMKHFYMGRHTIKCTKLKRLEVKCCEKLKIFPTETSQSTNEENPVFSAKVIPNLECMEINFDEAREWLLMNTEKYQMHCLKELSLSSVESADLLFQFLYRMPNLEKLSISSGSLEKLVPSANIAPQERLGTVLQLKELVLWSSEIKDLGFEREPVLQRLELLSLYWCNKLSNLAPPSVSLAYLTNLEVEYCSGLKNLMASSTAKSLVQLKSLKVSECDKVEQIVTNEGNEEDDKVIEIVFSKLITIELVSLENLKSFCSYKNCKFKFPSLEILIVRECLMMETFTGGSARAPKLQNILAVEGDEEAKWQWEGDLNATIHKVFEDKVCFRYTNYLNLSSYPDLIKQLWHCNHLELQNNFSNLTSLTAAECNSLQHVIPCHLLPCFENLERLEVRNCSEVQVIFNINEIRETKDLGIIRLKKLSLTGLPKLEHVWDKDPQGIIGLKVLQDMRVQNCDCLTSLFPASAVKDIIRSLEVLLVINCRELVEIFSKDEKAAEGATKKFVFSCLTSLTLKELPGLKYFYPGLHTQEWPVLEELDAFHCELMKLKCQQDHPIQIEKVIQMDQIPSLKKLSFGIGDNWSVTWDRESARQLQFDNLQRFQENSDRAPLYRFLDMLRSNIDKLVFNGCSFEEMFSAERPNADCTRILLHLKGLELRNMYRLKSIGLEHSWLQPFPENLQTLQVEGCWGLDDYLVPSTISFSNLTYLKVSSCHSLAYLFTSSTAKSLAQLKKMEIKECRSLKEIVSREGDETRENKQIIFVQLQVLYLQQLDQLSCFYPGNFALFFPSLEQVYVIDCSSMKTFSPVNKVDHSAKWYSAGYARPQQECDLNSAARRTYEEKFLESARSMSDISLRDNPLKEIWLGSRQIPNLCFSNLDSLTVDGCQFLFDAVLPFNLLPFLTKLKKLEVQNCDYVKTIFGVKRITQDREMTTMGPATFPLPFALKKLTLWRLPNLENVWNEDPHRILRMKLLQKVSVENCECLTSVFPASVAKDLVELENLVVKDCKELMEIVAEDNADPSGANLELTFPCPCVRSLKLQGLPKLKYFYCCSRQCDLLKTGQEPHTEDHVCIEKCLALGENGLEMILCGEFPRELLHKLKVLTLFFPTESNVFPYEILQQVPNIEKLVVFDGSFKEIFCSRSPNVDDTGLLPQLKVLCLESLQKLISVALKSSWIEPFLRNLETLQVDNCYRLKNLVPCTVSFSALTYLEVKNCSSLLYLFTCSTAKSLAQLNRMEIKSCNSIEEIVSKEGDESNEDEIIFPQLNCLNLEYLPKLRSFYKGSLSFPSLEQLSVTDCDWMETLCARTVKADKLFEVKLESYSNAIRLAIDLKSTMQKAFLAKFSKSAQSVSYLILKDSPLQEIWHGSLPIPDSCFSNLGSLTVDGCQFLSDAVLPFNLLPFFTKLETLKVRNCDSVKSIFDLKCITQDRMMTSPLKKLTLSKLPNLENVWNEDPHGILSIQLLEEVEVENCKCLTSVFPASVAIDLEKNLKNLALKDCEGLTAIVAEDNADPKGTNLELKFLGVTSLTLWDLPKFKYNSICCIHDATTTFELTPNLQHLTLGENELKMILDGEFQGNYLQKLKVLTLQFHIECDLFPYGFLQKVRNVEKLVVCSGSFKEIFYLQSPIVDDTGFLSQLKVLRLESLPELVSIGLENSWIVPFLRNLETLQVISCSSLKILVRCIVSFSNLTYLKVQDCSSLLYLFTSSAAKSMTQLKKLKIKLCDSIEEVVSTEEDESNEDEIIFPQLNCLNLENLPNLKSFYRGSLSFPSLNKLSLIDCVWMETLCPGTVKADKLFEVKFQSYSDAIPLEIDLKSTMRKEFLARFSESEDLTLKDSPVLQEIWNGSLPIPDSCFSNLHTLILDGCQFLSDAVLPFNLLPFLTKLAALEVRNCDFVKTIFDVKCITQDMEMTTMGPARIPLPYALKKLILERLPNLENVWNADPKGTNLELTFPRVKSLTLCDLPKFKNFWQCDMLKSFTHLEPHTENQVCIEKLTPNLEHLTLGENELKMIFRGEFQGNHLHKLKVLGLFFHIESDVFLQRVPNIEKLVVCDGSFKEIFCFHSLNVDEAELLSQLKVLCMDCLPELVSIGSENSWIVPFLRNLKTMEVISCFSSINLVPCKVSFSNLTLLEVESCKSLLYLFTSSTAKSLAQLKTMKIKGCDSIEEVVSKEVDESHEDEIVFWQLNCLKLKYLPKLRSFYRGSLSFPSLEELSVIDCDRMKTFCAGTVKVDKLLGVKFNWSGTVPLETDLNSAMQNR